MDDDWKKFWTTGSVDDYLRIKNRSDDPAGEESFRLPGADFPAKGEPLRVRSDSEERTGLY